MTRFTRKLRYTWHHTRKRRVAAVLLVVFALVNGGIYLEYRERTYPRTTVNGQYIGSVQAGQLPQRISELSLLPDNIKLSYDGKTTDVATAGIGMKIDTKQTAKSLLDDNRSWLPAINLIRPPQGTATISVEPKTYQRKILEIGKSYKKNAADAVLALRDGNFVITPEVAASSIDTPGSQANIVKALGEGRGEAELMMRQTPPRTTSASLQPKLQELQAQRNTPVSLNYAGKNKKFSANQVGNWFKPSPGSNSNEPNFELAPERIADAVADASLELGVNTAAIDQTAATITTAVTAKKAADIALNGPPIGSKAYKYCTAGRGVPAAEVQALGVKADSVLNASRGWSLGNHVSFKQASEACDFTLWLSAANQMSSFGSICDAMWSCAVRPNVIINYDRWSGASETWNKSGGSLDEYRAMAINHEVGHWLGFQHSSCPAPGRTAPVMQQQSINLQGCVFSAWPSRTERFSLKSFLGL